MTKSQNKQKLLRVLKDIMLCDGIEAREKQEILDMVLHYQGKQEAFINLLEKFLKAKNFASLNES